MNFVNCGDLFSLIKLQDCSVQHTFIEVIKESPDGFRSLPLLGTKLGDVNSGALFSALSLASLLIFSTVLTLTRVAAAVRRVALRYVFKNASILLLLKILVNIEDNFVCLTM